MVVADEVDAWPKVLAGPAARLGGGRARRSLGPGTSLEASLFLVNRASSRTHARRSSRAVSGETLVHEVSPGNLTLV